MDKIRFQRVLRRVYLVPLGLAVILAVLLILEVQFLTTRDSWVEHADQVITSAQRVYRARIDQETGLRAYLLTNDKSFLQPSYQGRDDARKLEAQLELLISDNPEQQERNAKAAAKAISPDCCSL